MEKYRDIITMTKKLQQRCPLNYSLLRAFVSLDSCQSMKDKHSAMTHFRTVMKEGSLLTVQQCDLAEQEFIRPSEEETATLKQFISNESRLDEFYHSLIANNPNYSNVWKVSEKCLVLSHGQAAVERGFSINKDMLLPNMRHSHADYF